MKSLITGTATGVKKGDSVLYCGQVYKVAQVFNNSNVIAIKAIGKRTDINYVWAWKCRKVDGE